MTPYANHCRCHIPSEYGLGHSSTNQTALSNQPQFSMRTLHDTAYATGRAAGAPPHSNLSSPQPRYSTPRAMTV